MATAADLKLAWDSATDGLTTGYVVVYGQASGSYSQQVDAGSATSCTITNLSAGATYYFAVRGYDANGDMSGPSTEISTTIPTNATAPIVTSLSLTPSVTSPQVVGTPVNWAATAAGGATPYEFQWSVYQSGSLNVGPWTTTSTLNWIPSIAGNDQIGVAVRSAGSTSATGDLSQIVPFTAVAPISSVTLTSNVTSPEPVKTTILWSAVAAGGIKPYQYQWWLYNGSSWTAMTSWTTSATWWWTPTAASNGYVVRVWVRSAGQTINAAEGSASQAFAITKPKCQGVKCR